MKPLEPLYSRSPSPELQDLMKKGGFLSPIIRIAGKKIGQLALSLDVHLRPDDQVHVYCGHARILVAVRTKGGAVKINADRTYQKYHKEFFRTWQTDEPEFEESLNDYLNKVSVADRFTDKEGKLQTDWSRVTVPWVPFDREAVLSYKNVKKEDRNIRFPEVEMARSIIRDIASRPGRDAKPWAKPESRLGNEVDQLAVDKEGNLVLIEIKDAAASSAQVFYSPLQLLQYVHEWRRAFGWLSVSSHLQKLVDTRIDLGLMPKVPPLTGGIRAAVCFGEDNRSDEVKRRYYETLGVINAYLPAHVLPVETWSYGEKGPVSL